jgi:hypothetical protein
MSPHARTVMSRVATVASVVVLAAAAVAAFGSGAVRPPGRGGATEALEQRETTERRLEALEAAIADGRFGEPGIRGRAAPGWIGARAMSTTTDDWEPAIAADPNSRYVYWLATRYGEPKPCPGNCPSPFTALRISRDGGATWGPARALCPCKGSAQYDPIVEVVPRTGDVYALFMNGFNVMFLRSTDHGQTWTDPVPTYGKVSWTDKPALTTSANGRHVYVTWNGPRGGDPWVAVSHDRGATWTQQRVVDGSRYFFAYDGTVLPDGTVVLSQSSIDYSGQGASAVGPIQQHVFVSTDRGATWRNVLVDRVEMGPPCETDGCYADFHSGHSAVSSDASGRLFHVYDGATVPGGPQAVWFRTSDDGGRTWSARTRLSAAGAHSTGPTIEAVGAGDLRVWFASMNDAERWNVFARRSTDGGATWSAPVKINDAISGNGYDTANGFFEFYGDYGEIAVTNRGKTVATWGEGFSWLGPGNVWVNVQA